MLLQILSSLTNARVADWLSHAIPAVFVPVCITCFALLKHFRLLNRQTAILLFGSTVLTAITGQWMESGGMLGLHLTPVFFIVLAVLNYRGRVLPASLAFGLTFVSLVICDSSLALHYNAGMDWTDALEGVGGAGWLDGLLFFPTAAALLQGYVKARRRDQVQVGIPAFRHLMQRGIAEALAQG